MISIALDGPSGAGKSSLSKYIADKLSFIHVDTGAIYRSAALYVVNSGVEPSDSEKVVALLDGLNIDVVYDENRKQHIFVNGQEVLDKDIRTNEISMASSTVSAIPEVREFLLDLQRGISERENIIMDGRDVGTVVLPNADIKFFVSASPEKRAERRLKEYLDKGIEISYDKVLEDIIQRDINDSTRDIAPLKQADDAIVVDNSEMTEEETQEYVLSIIRGKI